MQRTRERYITLVEQLSSKYEVFEHQGLESYLFVIDGRLLKIYQWFLLTDLSPEEEFKLWKHQQWLLSIYAPGLDVQVIVISPDAALCETSNEIFCYGLSISRGEPFIPTIWNQAPPEECMRWASQIGITLAERHLAAPQQKASFHEESTVLIAWMNQVLDKIDNYPVSIDLVPNARIQIVQAVKKMIQFGEIARPANIPVVHGDLNLSNIILYGNDLQFIDPGPALLLGIGIENPHEWTLDVWWDVLLLSNAFLRRGDTQAREMFLQSYCERCGFTNAAMMSHLRYWEALHDLMVVAICCKRWEDFQAETNPFARFLHQSGISLRTYTQYFFAQSLKCLHIADQFPTFIEQIERENLSF